jgi:hypothetical protein
MRFTFLAAGTLVFAACSIAQPPDAAPGPNTESPAEAAPALDPLSATDARTFESLSIPPLLRMHLPMLRPGTGRLVQFVPPGSEAERLGLRTGDVLLRAGGRAVSSNVEFRPNGAQLPLLVIRRGRTIELPSQFGRPGFSQPFRRGFPPEFVPMPGPQRGAWNRPRARSGVAVSSASVSSASGQAVSISRAGDQISLEMRLPQFTSQPIRLNGTLAEIEQQLQASDLPEPAKQQVRQSLRDGR